MKTELDRLIGMLEEGRLKADATALAIPWTGTPFDIPLQTIAMVIAGGAALSAGIVALFNEALITGKDYVSLTPEQKAELDQWPAGMTTSHSMTLEGYQPLPTTGILNLDFLQTATPTEAVNYLEEQAKTRAERFAQDKEIIDGLGETGGPSGKGPDGKLKLAWWKWATASAEPLRRVINELDTKIKHLFYKTSPLYVDKVAAVKPNPADLIAMQNLGNDAMTAYDFVMKVVATPNQAHVLGPAAQRLLLNFGAKMQWIISKGMSLAGTPILNEESIQIGLQTVDKYAAFQSGLSVQWNAFAKLLGDILGSVPPAPGV